RRRLAEHATDLGFQGGHGAALAVAIDAEVGRNLGEEIRRASKAVASQCAAAQRAILDEILPSHRPESSKVGSRSVAPVLHFLLFAARFSRILVRSESRTP